MRYVLQMNEKFFDGREYGNLSQAYVYNSLDEACAAAGPGDTPIRVLTKTGPQQVFSWEELAVSEILYRYDVAGVSAFGAPYDEYDGEARTIVAEAPWTSENLLRYFEKMFDGVVTVEELQSSIDDITKSINDICGDEPRWL